MNKERKDSSVGQPSSSVCPWNSHQQVQGPVPKGEMGKGLAVAELAEGAVDSVFHFPCPSKSV